MILCLFMNCVHNSWCVCRGQKTTCMRWFVPPVTWGSRILKWILSHLVEQKLFILMFENLKYGLAP